MDDDKREELIKAIHESGTKGYLARTQIRVMLYDTSGCPLDSTAGRKKTFPHEYNFLEYSMSAHGRVLKPRLSMMQMKTALLLGDQSTVVTEDREK